MGLSSEQIAELQRDLQTLQRELEQSLADTASAARPVELDQPTMGRLSRMDAIQQQKMLEANRMAMKSRMQLVGAALGRLNEDDYGDCMSCGESIAYSRLKARPESVFCVGCQTLREQKGSR